MVNNFNNVQIIMMIFSRSSLFLAPYKLVTSASFVWSSCFLVECDHSAAVFEIDLLIADRLLFVISLLCLHLYVQS